MTALKTTPFYQAHQDAGAKLVDFAGWELPIHYGSQIAEHEAVRTDAGMFDVSHMLVTDVAGANAEPVKVEDVMAVIENFRVIFNAIASKRM